MEITRKNATMCGGGGVAFYIFLVEPGNGAELLQFSIGWNLVRGVSFILSIATTICVSNTFIYPLLYQMLNKSRRINIYFAVIFVT